MLYVIGIDGEEYAPIEETPDGDLYSPLGYMAEVRWNISRMVDEKYRLQRFRPGNPAAPQKHVGGFGTAAAGQPGDGKGRSVRNVLFRRNECLNNSSISIGGNLHGALVEHNRIEHTDLGVHVTLPASGVLLRANRVADVTTPTWGDGLEAPTIMP